MTTFLLCSVISFDVDEDVIVGSVCASVVASGLGDRSSSDGLAGVGKLYPVCVSTCVC